MINICSGGVRAINIYRRLRNSRCDARVERKMKNFFLLVCQVVGVSLFKISLC